MTELTTTPTNQRTHLPLPPRNHRVATQLATTLIYPPFLQRLDRTLLLNTPWLWATKLHRVTWLSIFPLLLALILGISTPISRPYLMQRTITSSVVIIVTLQIALLIYWLYTSHFRHVEDEYGQLRDHTGWREFASHALTLMLIGSSLVLYLSIAQRQIRSLDVKEFSTDLFWLSTNRNISTSRANTTSNRYLYQTNVPAFQLKFSDNLKNGSVSSLLSLGYKNHIFQDFLDQNLLIADIRPMAQAISLQGDTTALSALIAHYSGLTPLEIESSKQTPPNQIPHQTYRRNTYASISNQAFQNVSIMFKLAHNESTFLLQNLTYALIAFALHGALLRFIIHHAKLRGSLLLLGSIAQFAIVWGLFIISMDWLSSYRRRLPSGAYAAASHFQEQVISIIFTVFILYVGTLYWRVSHTTKKTHFSWYKAAQLNILPLLIILVPYALILIFNTQTDIYDGARHSGFFYTHLLQSPAALGRPHTWSLYPLGNHILFWAQFAYLPLLPFLKRQHTHLLALPKR